MKWHILDSCRNSPKNQLLIDWVQKFVEGRDCSDFIKDDSIIQIENTDLSMKQFDFLNTIEEIRIETAISHGKIGAMHGQAMTQHNTFNFALFFEFTLGKQPKLLKTTCIYQ